MKNNKTEKYISCALISIILLILSVTLFAGHTVGLSDNGDFIRIMAPNHIQYMQGTNESFVFTKKYNIGITGSSKVKRIFNTLFTLNGSYATTQHLFIKLSLLLNLAFNVLSKNIINIYHIQWLGIIYCILLASALGLIIIKFRSGKRWFDYLLYTLIIIMFCDVSYIAYFNSFYGEAVQYVSLLALFAFLISFVSGKQPKTIFILLYYAAVIIFIGSKFANVPAGLMFALAGLSFLLFKDAGKFIKTILSICLILSVLASGVFFLTVPEWMDRQTTYHSVFYGVLKGSPDPIKDLEQLGLPEYMAVLKDTSYYTANHKIDINSDRFVNDFYKNISKTKVLAFYIKNPARLWQKLNISCMSSSLIRPKYLSNYGADYPRLSFSNKFSLWSTLREKIPFDNIYFILMLFVLSFVIILAEFRHALALKDKGHKIFIICTFYLALLATTVINFIVPVITNGEADLAKHMFGFITGIDIIFLSVFLWLIYKLSAALQYITTGSGFFARYRRIILAAAAVLIILTVIPLKLMNKAAISFEKPETGAYVSMGRYNGTKLLWQINSIDENGILLLSVNPVAYGSFSDKTLTGDPNRLKYGSNNWGGSRIRKWLNESFVKSFNSQESSLLNTYKNKVLLSVYDKGSAAGGDKDFLWSDVPSIADYGYDEAYFTYSYDKVFLLDIRQLEKYAAGTGLPCKRSCKYWLETPYYNNSSMVRVVDTDGHIYMQDAVTDKIGIIPAVYINRNTAVTGGHGSVNDPFELSSGL